MRNIPRAALWNAPNAHAAFRTQARLFGLLALLVPLFAGLEYLVREAVPRVEIRLVSQDVPAAVPVLVPVEVPVERVVERIVYVQGDRSAAVTQPDAPLGLSGAVALPAPSSDVAAGVVRENRDTSRSVELLASADEGSPEATEAPAPPNEPDPIFAPAPALIATGTYRPQVVLTAARASAPIYVPEAEPEPELAVEDEIVEDAAVAEAPEPAVVDEQPEVRRVLVANVESSGATFVVVSSHVEYVEVPAEEAVSDQNEAAAEDAEGVASDPPTEREGDALDAAAPSDGSESVSEAPAVEDGTEDAPAASAELDDTVVTELAASPDGATVDVRAGQ